MIALATVRALCMSGPLHGQVIDVDSKIIDEELPVPYHDGDDQPRRGYYEFRYLGQSILLSGQEDDCRHPHYVGVWHK